MFARSRPEEADNHYHLPHPSSRMDSSSSRMAARPASYVAPPTFSSDVGSMAPIQIDETSQYASTPEPSSEADLLPDPSNNPIVSYGSNYAHPPASTNSRVRVLKAPRVRRRPRAATADKKPNLVITEPLSVLTKHLRHVELKDMKKWATRPLEERLQEVADKNGKIARPMNSFMLYRAAYANRTKEWCRKNNHQVVSQVAGKSWPLEPPEIREEFELLALIERDNHQKAHPDYKFAPNKTQTLPRRKRPLADESSEGEEATDVNRGPAQSSPISVKRVKPLGLSSSFTSRDSTPLESQEPLLETYHPSAWQLPGGRPMAPPIYPSHENGYFMSPPGLVRAANEGHPVSGPGLISGHYASSTSLVGMPGGVHQDLVRSYPSGHTVGHLEDTQLDPQLLSSDVAGGDLRSFSWPNFASFRHTDQDFTPYFNLAGNNMGYEAMNGYPTTSGTEDSSLWAACEDGLSEVSKDLDGWLQPSTGYPC